MPFPPILADHAHQDRVRHLQAFLGVSRLAIQTGLDRIGLPVVAAIRPLSASLTVSFGKGLTLEAAETAALMEAAELFFSEQRPAQLGGSPSFEPSTTNIVPAQSGTRSPFVTGLSLVTGTPTDVPWDSICMDMSLGAVPNDASGTGLAAHWDRDSAVLHALLEVIERDAHQRWNDADDEVRCRTLLDMASVTDTVSLDLLRRLQHLKLVVLAWDLATDTETPCIMIEIVDRAPKANAAYSQGVAAHLDHQIAFRKALMEAIQIRLTYIAGSRDDLGYQDYGDRYLRMVATRPEVFDWVRPQRFLPARQGVHDSDATMLAQLAIALQRRGCEPLVCDLAPAEAQIAVVKVLVSGLQDIPDADVFVEANTHWLEGAR